MSDSSNNLLIMGGVITLVLGWALSNIFAVLNDQREDMIELSNGLHVLEERVRPCHDLGDN